MIKISNKIPGGVNLTHETTRLHMLKAKSTDFSNTKIAGKFDGYSEAWSKSTFTLQVIKALMRLTIGFEEVKK